MSTFSHFIHLVITIVFFPWILVWVICAVSSGNKRRKIDDRKRDEQIALLKDIASQTRRNK